MIQNLNQSPNDPIFWQKHVAQFKASNQTKAKYCKQHELTYHRFLYWYTKLTKAKTQNSHPVELIPVRVSKPETTAPKDCIANVELGNGVKINIFDEVVLFKIIESVG